ncbi:MAG TPA: BREX protein BrxB domain-containing protein [Actinomycetales bacterium]|nr:BREX protein BrxB domain-containing protein [Actinomycetales bacterium]
MSVVGDLVETYRRQVELPWAASLSPAERVWIAVYPPEQERRLRAHLPQLALHTTAAERSWRTVDITDAFGRWIASHEYRDTFFESPEYLTSSVLEGFESAVQQQIRDALTAPEVDERTVVCVIGAGALFPFARASRVIEAVDSATRGRLLVLFPGRHDSARSSYRLLDARDGWNYRAVPITVPGETP